MASYRANVKRIVPGRIMGEAQPTRRVIYRSADKWNVTGRPAFDVASINEQSGAQDLEHQ
jgi:hypothetical protein